MVAKSSLHKNQARSKRTKRSGCKGQGRNKETNTKKCLLCLFLFVFFLPLLRLNQRTTTILGNVRENHKKLAVEERSTVRPFSRSSSTSPFPLFHSCLIDGLTHRFIPSTVSTITILPHRPFHLIRRGFLFRRY